MEIPTGHNQLRISLCQPSHIAEYEDEMNYMLKKLDKKSEMEVNNQHGKLNV